MKRKITSYEIVLSALAAALATIFLSVGALSSVMLFTGYLLASLCLCLPLCRQGYAGYLFAYATCCLLTMLFCGFAFFFRLLPFMLFFGLHPLFNEIQLTKKWNKYICFFVKAVWFDGALILTWWLLFNRTLGVAFIDAYFIPLAFVVGTVLFFLYDWMHFECRKQMEKVLLKIFKK